MSGNEVRAARERMALSHAELAEELGVSEAAVRGWEDGSVKPPRGTTQDLAVVAAVLERRAALKASGLPECPWVEEWEQQPDEPDLEGMTARLEQLNEHSAACPTCKARDRYLEDRFPPLPERYMPVRMRVLFGAMAAIERLPGWLQPAATGAALLFAITSLRMLGMAIGYVLGQHSPEWGGVAPALLAATGAGASGGLVYSAVRPAFVRLGRAGDYLTGVACVLAYMISIALAAPVAFGETFLESRASWVILLVMSTGFGLFIGHSWFRPARLSSERPGSGLTTG